MSGERIQLNGVSLGGGGGGGGTLNAGLVALCFLADPDRYC